MRIPFVKMHGCGNDFILIDETRTSVMSKILGRRFARQACDRHRSIGADGAIFLAMIRKKSAALAARFFMPDGSESEMCGNGARCVAAYAVYSGIAPMGKEIVIATMKRIVRALVSWRRRNIFKVQVSLGSPRLGPSEIPIGAQGGTFVGRRISVPNVGAVQMTAVDTGVPHAIIFTDDIEHIDVEEVGRAVRHMRTIFPHGTNVDFVEFNGLLRVRTYERGVERETLSCGTGVAAAAVAAYLAGRTSANRPIEVMTKGGRLTATIVVKDGLLKTVLLTGPAEIAFRGEVEF